MKFHQILSAAAVSSLAVFAPIAANAAPVTIGFENLGGSLLIPINYNGSQESGFDIATSGDQFQALNGGAFTVPPLVDTYILAPADVNGDGSGTLIITELAAATQFQFSGLDIFGLGGTSLPPAIIVEGFLGMALVGTDSFTQPSNTAGSHVAVNLLNKNVDRLEIHLTSITEGYNPHIDNIALETNPIPVPAPLALLLGSIAAMGALKLRRKA